MKEHQIQNNQEIQELRNLIGEFKSVNRQQDKFIDEKEKEVLDKVKYEAYYHQDLEKKSKRKAIAHKIAGYALFAVGLIFATISVLAIIPASSDIVAPLFSSINTASTLQSSTDSNNITMLTIFVAIAIACIPSGIKLFNVKYDVLWKRYKQKYDNDLYPPQ